MTITVYSARRILTMNPARPEATHVAVRDGGILGVGTLDELRAWGPHVPDTRFADKVLMPGLIEAHSHIGEGGIWRSTYCGFHDRTDPDGRLWKGATSIDQTIERLAQAQSGLADRTAADRVGLRPDLASRRPALHAGRSRSPGLQPGPCCSGMRAVTS